MARVGKTYGYSRAIPSGLIIREISGIRVISGSDKFKTKCLILDAG
jgi:hypothetical protein